MQIKDLFARPIDRELDGVIKADENSDAKVRQELDEYVVTDELAGHFAKFWGNYAKSLDTGTGKMGVWIKGFFGSGKSHFLKILAYLLENREIDGRHAIDYFDADKKLKSQKTIADIRKAESVPTDVILFNIDAKASKRENESSILNVFVRVFNEMQGFCGSMPYLADLERNLSKKGRYEEFKEKFKARTDEDWVETRDDFDFISDDVVETLVLMGYMSVDAARAYCEKVTGNSYDLSIEDFAQRVADYVHEKGNNHHVVFLIDEIGQYVAQDTGRMLNLQTMAEQLGTRCNGQAWIVVTSQQAIDEITRLKDFSDQDFSRIQARFDTRISLSSADADVVIKKRILSKKPQAALALSQLYEKNAEKIANLYYFTGEAEHKMYKDGQNYALDYPFVPYQFDLLPKTLNQIRQSGSAGKSISSGERSLLSMFKESAETHKEDGLSFLMPYHAFYEPLADFLDHSNRIVITNAYKNEKINPNHDSENFTVDVLKTLFLIKGLNTVIADVPTIATLMMDDVDTDRLEIENKVKKSLQLLVSQQLIQKNGDTYLFLSNDEQDINRKIHNQDVQDSDVKQKMKEIIFDGIYKDRKYRYSQLKGRYTFNVAGKLDDSAYRLSPSDQIGINVLTPGYRGADDESSMLLKSADPAVRDVLVILPQNDGNDIYEEINMYLKINRFYQVNASNLSEGELLIKGIKTNEARERYHRAEVFLQDALSNARIYVNGSLLNSHAKDPVARINEGLERLVHTEFNKLDLIQIAMDTDDVEKCIRNLSVDVLVDGGGEANEAAQDEVLRFIQQVTHNHTVISRKSVEDRFHKVPYGWNDDDIHWILARLFVRGKITFQVNGEYVTRQNRKTQELADYLMKRQYGEKLMFDERHMVPDNQKRIVRGILSEVFHDSLVGYDEDSLMTALRGKLNNLNNELNLLETKYTGHSYPGKQVVDAGRNLAKTLLDARTPIEFFKLAYQHEDDFLDFGEDIRDVETFFDRQYTIFDRAERVYGVYQKSSTYITDPNVQKVADGIHTILRESKPYSDMDTLSGLIEEFMQAYSDYFDNDLVPVQSEINHQEGAVLDAIKGKPYEGEKKPAIQKSFAALSKNAENAQDLAALRSFKDQAEVTAKRYMENTIPAWDVQWAKAHMPKVTDHTDSSPTTPKPPVLKEKKVTSVTIREVVKDYSWTIDTPADIDTYVNRLKKNLESELKAGETLKVRF